MQITKGVKECAQKVVVYGPEGIGKSTFASKFPDPLFVDTEGSTKHMDVARTPEPGSWKAITEQIQFVKDNPTICKTLVIDTADWAEQLCISAVCSNARKSGIEDFGYGKGYVYLAEEFSRFLRTLDEIISKGIHVVITAHAKMRKVEQPDESGAYDRWELKLQKHTAPLLKEWADMVLFANYKIYVINTDGQGVEKGKNKAQGGKRVMYTTHHPCWDAKNRHGLADELSFDYAEIAHCITSIGPVTGIPVTEERAPPPSALDAFESVEFEDLGDIPTPFDNAEDKPAEQLSIPDPAPGVPAELAELMKANQVYEVEIQEAVSRKGYYPENTPIENYDPNFIDSVLIACWPQVFELIQNEVRTKNLPF